RSVLPTLGWPCGSYQHAYACGPPPPPASPRAMALSRLAMRSLARAPAARLARSPAVGGAVAAGASRHLHASASRTAAKMSPAELTKILSDRISNFSDQQDVQEVGRVLSVGDGIARIYGLKGVKA
ncbi:unnamed protein product, partial [Prorocentrum cordatum]